MCPECPKADEQRQHTKPALTLSLLCSGRLVGNQSACSLNNEVCQTAADFSHVRTLTNLPPLCPVWEFLLRWELVVLKMDSRARSCSPSWNSESDRWSVTSRPPEDSHRHRLTTAAHLKSESLHVWGFFLILNVTLLFLMVTLPPYCTLCPWNIFLCFHLWCYEHT